ncbi:MAG: ATP-binding cassette domain-containing protein, partial [Clostridia bacterium]
MAAKHPSLSAAIELVQLTKTFGNVVANHRIDFVVRKGEILALLGENGSGKTTLMNMLSGLYRPDSGCIYVKGEQVDLHSPKDAIARGIGMIHQHFKLVDVLTASENIVLGLPKKKGQNAKALSEEIRTISRRFGLDVDPDQNIYQMSVSQKQTVEILKVLYRGADVLILDEPTAVLTPQETDRLFDILRRMKAEGCAVIIITHKLNEVMAISDRITILRRGESIATVEKEKTNINELTEMMVGHKISLQIDCPQVSQRPLLAVRDLTIATDEGRRILDQVSFELQGGDVAALVGG